jgi:hypothetical protein
MDWEREKKTGSRFGAADIRLMPGEQAAILLVLDKLLDIAMRDGQQGAAIDGFQEGRAGTNSAGQGGGNTVAAS